MKKTLLAAVSPILLLVMLLLLIAQIATTGLFWILAQPRDLINWAYTRLQNVLECIITEMKGKEN